MLRVNTQNSQDAVSSDKISLELIDEFTNESVIRSKNLKNAQLEDCLKLFELINDIDKQAQSNIKNQADNVKLTVTEKPKKQQRKALQFASLNGSGSNDTEAHELEKAKKSLRKARVAFARTSHSSSDQERESNATPNHVNLNHDHAFSRKPAKSPTHHSQADNQSKRLDTVKIKNEEKKKKRFYSLREMLDYLHSEQGATHSSEQEGSAVETRGNIDPQEESKIAAY